jgi:Kef-type K+ transport system membrane component KefB
MNALTFLPAIILLLLLAKIFGEVFERIGMPALLGEILAGVVLGVAFLNVVTAGSLEQMSMLGIILLLFLVGFNFSIEKMKQGGKTGVLLTLFGFFFVLVPSYFIFKSIGLGLVHAIFFSLIMGGESTPNTIKTIVDLKRLRSKVSEIIISATVIEDFIFYTILALTVAFVGATGIGDYAIGLGKVALFFLVFIVMEFVSPYIIRYSEHMRSEEAQFAIGFVLILFLAFVADMLGFAAVVGAFFAGIALAYSPYLKTGSFSPKIASFTYGVFSPLFFAWMGLQIDPAMFKLSAIVWLLIGVGLGAKLIGNMAGAMLGGTSFHHALGASIGMMTRGGEQLLILVIAAQVLGAGSAMFVNSILIPVTIISMVITLFLSPALLKLFFKFEPKEEQVF